MNYNGETIKDEEHASSCSMDNNPIITCELTIFIANNNFMLIVIILIFMKTLSMYCILYEYLY